MSVLVFLDESRWDRPEKKDYFATIAGVAIEEYSLADFTRKLMRLKGRFFKRSEIGSFPLRGRLLLSNRAQASYRKQEFVRELFSLCRLHQIVTFSTTRKCSLQQVKPEYTEFIKDFQRGSITNSDKFTEKQISILLAYLMERVNSYVLENHPGQQAKLVFKSTGEQRDSVRCSSMMNFVYNTTFGGGFFGLLGNPLFAPAPATDGLQVADLFAYIINQWHGGRTEMGEYFEEVESMQFISSIEQDEFKLRGMNLIN